MADVVIVGAGGCGLMAALVAADHGADVVVLEKTRQPGGGTALSHRALRAAGTRFQREQGIDDDPEQWASEILLRNGHQSDNKVTRALTCVSSRMVEFLADVAGVDFYLQGFTFGQSAARSHAWKQDASITGLMFDALRSRSSVAFHFQTPVKTLLTYEGAVTGVKADGIPYEAEAVVLASGGFGASRRLLSRHIANASGIAFPGHQGSTGEGIEMGVELGAATRHMDSFQPYPAHIGPGKRGLPPGVIMSGGIVVDDCGRRFVDETNYPGGLARAILELPAHKAYEIFDERIFETHREMTGERSIVAMRESGELVEARDGDSLAEALGIDAEGLQRTLDEYAAVAGDVDEFGRAVDRPLRPPLHGIQIRVALYHTQGGLKVDEHARVLRDDDSVIPRLYAGGGAAAGVSGDGMDGYLPGNGLLASLGLGFLAAEHAVAGSRVA